MSKTFYGIAYSFLLEFFSKGWTDDLKISFKKSIFNDVKNHPVKLALIPIALFLMLSFLTTALVFIIYGASHWFLMGEASAIADVITGGVLLLFSMFFALVFARNVQFVFERIESVQSTFVEVQTISPFHQLFQQIKNEQKMFLEAFAKKTQTKEYI